jgi:DNA-binding FadR family transcriptional regulator
VLTVDDIVQGSGVSRSVAREAVRVLESLGLVRPRRHVGIVVLPETDWRLLDPNVIRWQLASPRRIGKLRELTQLRAAMEPEAAAEAARRISHDPAAAAELVRIAAELAAAGSSDDADGFLDADVRFHLAVLRASGNRMFEELGSLVGEALRGRTGQGLVPRHPHADAVSAHVRAAAAIVDGEPERAREAMRGTMGRVEIELRDIGHV